MARRSVMLIEDDGVIARDLQDTLVELGFRVTGIATNAADALSLAARDTPDVALVDIRIQGPRDGIETADELYKKHHVPVVFLSAYADGVTVARAKRASPFGYLVKPFRAAEIKTSIEVAVYHAKMQRALAERQGWFETTIASLDDAVVCTDQDDRVQLMNRAAEELTGWSAESARGMAFKKVVQLESPLVDTGSGAATGAAAEGDVLGTLVRRRGGGETVVSTRRAPIIADGQSLGAVMVLRDTSEEFRLRAQCEFLERMAALGTLAASVAHEVNNPLSVVMGNLDLLLSEAQLSPAMRMEMLADVRDAAGRIRTIIGDLRGLWQQPEQTPDGTASVERTIKWALEVTTHETRHFANVESVVEPGMTVGLSHVRLGQVLINLVRNAAQAIGPGYRGAVRVNARRVDERCVIRISDNGSGIPEELQARLFEPFFTTRGRDNGMGLGLYVSRRIVQTAGGDLEVHSELGQGTTFTVTLPLVEVDRPLAKVMPLNRQAVRRSDKILLVDDDPATVMALKRVLERSYVVVAATGGQAALELLEEDQDFDVVLLDLMMPDLPGDQVYLAIRDRFASLEPRVLLLTAGAISPPARDLVRRLGARVLRKPLSATELLESVDRFLGLVES